MGVVLCSGCAGISPAQLGQTAGTIAGAAIVPGVGAPIGALIGTLAGMVMQKKVDQLTEDRERKELSGRLVVAQKPAAESLIVPQGSPVRVWVDETVQEGRLSAGHFDVRQIP